MSGSGDHTLAAALQRVLLPPGLPDISDWAVATLYEPAGETVLVGGDFYDWFPLPNGNVLFLLGDVSGKGPVAGALGMSIRKALKGMVWACASVTEALPILERALADEFEENFATLCLIEVQPESGQAQIVLAGHPAPWLRRGGEFVEVDAPSNGMLGPGLQATWESAPIVLAPGDMLLLFSDGLSESRLPDGRLFAEGALQEFLRTLPQSVSSYETVVQLDHHLRRAVLPLNDDMIIGVLAYQPSDPVPHLSAGTGERVALRLSPDSSSVSLARRFTTDACRRWGTDEEVSGHAELVASELVTNAVLHARTDLELRVALTPGRVRVEVEDYTAAGRDLFDDAREHDVEVEHGRGLALVHVIADRVGVHVEESSKTVWATLCEPAGPAAPAGPTEPAEGAVDARGSTASTG